MLRVNKAESKNQKAEMVCFFLSAFCFLLSALGGRA